MTDSAHEPHATASASTESPGPAHAPEAGRAADFIRARIEADLEAAADHPNAGRLITRFPPEPNGYFHIGHAKAVCLNFGLPLQYADRAAESRCHLRFDDTNPTKEEQEFIDAIKADIRWLGFEWGEHEYYASDYFDTLYQWAEKLIEAGHAYVDEQSVEDMRRTRGTVTQPGTPSPYRNRPAAESLTLFRGMKAGEFDEGAKVLRARIDMASPNLNLRDPVLYRVLKAPHPRTGNTWCIYPMYDWAHGQSDWIEGVTHSLCSLEFENHRPLYDWFLDRLTELGIQPTPPWANKPRQTAAEPDTLTKAATEPGSGGLSHDSPSTITYRPRQYEFNRLNVSYTVTSKRKLRRLVEEGIVAGWDDPRMPTLAAMRRRGYPPAAIRRFVYDVGLSKRNQVMELGRLEAAIRDELNRTAHRRMAVLDPIKVVITNYDADRVERMEATNNPEDADAGTREVPFTRALYIERDDFMEDAPRKFFRLAPGREVRLRYGYWITCTDVVKDDAGQIVELHCTYDPQTRGGDSPPPDADGNVRKVKGTLHWVSAAHAVDAEVRLYDHLFATPDPEDPPAEYLEQGGDPDQYDFTRNLNPDSLRVVQAKVEPALADATPGEPIQFERLGYFTRDRPTLVGADQSAPPQGLTFNRTATLKDTWAKQSGK